MRTRPKGSLVEAPNLIIMFFRRFPFKARLVDSHIVLFLMSMLMNEC